MRKLIALIILFLLMNPQLYGLKYEAQNGLKNTKKTQVKKHKKVKIKEKVHIIEEDVKIENNLNGTNVKIRRR